MCGAAALLPHRPPNAAPDRGCAAHLIHLPIRNDGTTLYDNLKPERDYTTVFGWITEGFSLSYPATAGRTYDDFIAARENDNSDGDINFDMIVDRANLEAQPGFWTTGWEYSDGPSVVMSKLRANQNGVFMAKSSCTVGRPVIVHRSCRAGWSRTPIVPSGMAAPLMLTKSWRVFRRAAGAFASLVSWPSTVGISRGTAER